MGGDGIVDPILSAAFFPNSIGLPVTEDPLYLAKETHLTVTHYFEIGSFDDPLPLRIAFRLEIEGAEVRFYKLLIVVFAQDHSSRSGKIESRHPFFHRGDWGTRRLLLPACWSPSLAALVWCWPVSRGPAEIDS